MGGLYLNNLYYIPGMIIRDNIKNETLCISIAQ